ncbi:flavin reductase [Streptomyces armeniacus]|nr:flavin reductase [Streptomyces armeniacus]AZY92020.1 putative flavin reductase [Streptomyces armeniacus]
MKQSAIPPDPTRMRQVCGLFTTGVTVVTSNGPTCWAGATVNSFTSVSLTPPRVLFCLRHDSSLLSAVRHSGSFAVSILSRGQGDIARHFAAPGRVDFTRVSCRPGTGGAPLVDGALGFLECAVTDEVSGGDHQIVMGAVTGLGTEDKLAPLAFYRGALTELAAES